MIAALALAAVAALSQSQVLDVNRAVNASIAPASDAAQYGVADRWVVDPASGKGDCEDYALSKMMRLLELGEPAANLEIRAVMIGRQGHAVLVVRGQWVLDNRAPGLQRASDYRAVYSYSPLVALARAGRADLMAQIK